MSGPTCGRSTKRKAPEEHQEHVGTVKMRVAPGPLCFVRVPTPPGDFKNMTVYRNAAGMWRFNLRVGFNKAENFDGDAGAADKARARREVLKQARVSSFTAAVGNVPPVEQPCCGETKSPGPLVEQGA